MRSDAVSFIIPAYNCASTIGDSIESIMNGNIESGDEIIITNDASTDDTLDLLNSLKRMYPVITVLNHCLNKGGGAARNTAAEHANNQILFCLDSDNLLEKGSVQKLKDFMLDTAADIAVFQELHYFSGGKDKVTHKWIFKEGQTTFADYLSGSVVPGASGNYMFTKKSWQTVKGYPEFAGALDAWGFGLRQVAYGQKMLAMPRSYYYHRYGHESYWVRESKKGMTSLTALQILIPFLDQVNESDINYIMSRRGRYTWFENIDRRPIRVRSNILGKSGMAVDNLGNLILPATSNHGDIMTNIKKFFFRIH